MAFHTELNNLLEGAKVLNLPATVSKNRLSDLVETLEIDNQYATFSISLWGAQAISFKPKHDGRERLFKSNKIVLDGSRSLRAGIPVCWPWFAQREGFQKHGLVRMCPWQVLSASDSESYTEIVLSPIEIKGEGFDGDADVTLTVRVGKELSVTLRTKNTGSDEFEFCAALHTYFSVDDINTVELKGLSGTYSDKTRDWAMLETPEPYRFTEETDRIHLNPVKEVTIVQPASETGVVSVGHDSVVVWNPWLEVSTELPDMGPEGYLSMLCVETAVTQGKTLQPEESHSLTQVIS